MMRLLLNVCWATIAAASPLLPGCQAVPPPAASATHQVTRLPTDVSDSNVHLTSLNQEDDAPSDLESSAAPDNAEIFTQRSVTGGALPELEAWAISNNPTL